MVQDNTVNYQLPFTLSGTVVHGRQLGRKLGFPTANLRLDEGFIFPGDHGVYTVIVHLNHQSIPGIANAGVRPTIDGTWFQVEIHLFDFEGDIYGQTLAVTFIHFLRPERRFNNPGELAIQIGNDLEQAKMLFRKK